MMANPEPANMMANDPHKYLFDTDFGMSTPAPSANAPSIQDEKTSEPSPEVAVPEVEEIIVPTYSEEELAQARAEGMQTGRDEATRDMASALEQRLSTAIESLNSQVNNLFNAFIKDKDTHNTQAVSVAAVMVRKLFPAMNANHAMQETQHLIAEAMQRTTSAPALRIKVPTELYADIESKTKELAALNHREGVVNIIADDDMPIGDVHVDWEGGGMIRNTARIWEEINNILERNLGSTAQEMAAAIDAEQAQTIQEVVEPTIVGKNDTIDAESGQNTDITDNIENADTPVSE